MIEEQVKIIIFNLSSGSLSSLQPQNQRGIQNPAKMLDHGVLSDLDVVLQYILMVIVLFFGFLLFTDNRLPNSIRMNQGEEELPSDHLDESFQQGEQTFMPRLVRACSLCGRLSTITAKCSCCREALYCSQVCQSIHWRLWHKYECLEIEKRVNQGRVADAEETWELVDDPVNGSSSYSTCDEDEEDSDIEERGEEPTHESIDQTGMLGAVNDHNGCAVCGNPITKSSTKCQNHWKFGHELQGVVEEVNSDRTLIARQGRSAHPNARMLHTRYEEENNTHSSVPLAMGSSSKSLIIRNSQATTEEVQEEFAQRVRCLEEELANSRNENMLLKSERRNWDIRTKFVADSLHRYMTESQNKLLILEREKELISNAEKQARDMVHSLSGRLHCLQIAEEARVAEKRQQEAYIHTLQTECAKARRELEEESKCVRTLTMEREEANQRFINALNVAETADSRAATAEAELYDLKRIIIPTDDKAYFPANLLQFKKKVCAICLTNEKDMAFGCGHMTCRDCGSKISKCPICRKKITSRVKLFTG